MPVTLSLSLIFKFTIVLVALIAGIVAVGLLAEEIVIRHLSAVSSASLEAFNTLQYDKRLYVVESPYPHLWVTCSVFGRGKVFVSSGFIAIYKTEELLAALHRASTYLNDRPKFAKLQTIRALFALGMTRFFSSKWLKLIGSDSSFQFKTLHAPSLIGFLVIFPVVQALRGSSPKFQIKSDSLYLVRKDASTYWSTIGLMLT